MWGGVDVDDLDDICRSGLYYLVYILYCFNFVSPVLDNYPQIWQDIFRQGHEVSPFYLIWGKAGGLVNRAPCLHKSLLMARRIDCSVFICELVR